MVFGIKEDHVSGDEGFLNGVVTFVEVSGLTYLSGVDVVVCVLLVEVHFLNGFVGSGDVGGFDVIGDVGGKESVGEVEWGISS